MTTSNRQPASNNQSNDSSNQTVTNERQPNQPSGKQAKQQPAIVTGDNQQTDN
jgi:hypothetical protein